MRAQHVWNLIEAWREGRGEGADRRIRSWAEEVQWYEDYADGSGSAPKGLVTANWNDITEWHGNERVEVSDIPSRVCSLFERCGLEINWCDEVSMCDGCYKAIQTEPDCFSFRPSFMVGDGEILCQECIADDPEPWLEQCSAEGHHWTLDNIDPAEHGYTLAFEGEYFIYADKLASLMQSRGFHQEQWLFTQSSSYECDVYVKDEAWEDYQAREAAKDEEQKRTAFKLCTPVTSARYHEAVECDEGWCPCCTDWTAEMCEPDATDRKCENGDCGRSWVVGAETAMLMGLIEVTDDSAED